MKTCTLTLIAGTLPMSAWANLSALRRVELTANRLNGTLPHELASTCPELFWLSLDCNAFSGANSRTCSDGHLACCYWPAL